MKKADIRQQQLAENYIKEHLSRCPLCKTADTEWTFEHTAFMRDKRVKATCSVCHCTISAAYGEMKGVMGNGITEFLQGAASYEAMVRSVYGKKKGVTYIKILNAGDSKKAEGYTQKEIPMEELKEMFWE